MEKRPDLSEVEISSDVVGLARQLKDPDHQSAAYQVLKVFGKTIKKERKESRRRIAQLHKIKNRLIRINKKNKQVKGIGLAEVASLYVDFHKSRDALIESHRRVMEAAELAEGKIRMMLSEELP